MDVFGRIMAGAVTGVGFALGKWAFDTARQTVQHGQMHQLPIIISGLRHSLVPRRAQSAPASSDDTEGKTNKRKTPPPPDDAESKGSSEPPVKRPRMGTESEAGPSGSSSRTNAQATSIAQSHNSNDAAAFLNGNPCSANAGGASADANPSNSSANPVYATAVSSPSQSSSSPIHASPVAPPRHWSPVSVAGTGHMDIDFLITPSMPQTQGAPLPDAAAVHHTPEAPAMVSERLYEDFIHLHDRPAPQTNTPSTRASAQYPQVPYVSAHDAYLQSQLSAPRRQTSGSPRLRYSRTDKGKGKAFYKSSKLLTHTPTQPEFIQGSSQPRRRTTKPYRHFRDLPPIKTLGLLRALPKSDRKQSPSPQKRFAKLRRPTRSPTPPPRTFNRIFSSSPFCSCEHPVPVPYMPASPSPAPSSHVPTPTGSDVPLPSGLLFQSPFPQRGSPPTPEAYWRTPQLTMPVLPHPPLPPAPRPAHATLAPPLQHPVPQTLHSGVPSQLARSADLNAQAAELLSEVEADYNWRRRNGMAEPAAEESDADERALSLSPTPPAGWHPALEQPLSPLNGDAFGRSTYPDYSPGPSRAPLAAPHFGLAQFVAALEPVLPPIASLPPGCVPSQSQPASASGSDVGSLMYPSSGSARKLSSASGSEEYESEEEDELAEEEEEL